MLQTFSQDLTLREALETVAQIKEELERMKFDDAFFKKFKLLVERFSSFFSLTVENRTRKWSMKKIGVTERPRSLNSGKTIAMAICPIIIHVITCVSLLAQKHLARKSLKVTRG